MTSLSYFVLVLSILPAALANTGLYAKHVLGQPVPLPQLYIPTSTVLQISPANFLFQVADGSGNCPILTEALKRYYYLTFPSMISSDIPTSNGRESTSRHDLESNLDPMSRFRSKLNIRKDLKFAQLGPGGSEFDSNSLLSLEVTVKAPCDARSFPSENMVENYTLVVKAGDQTAHLSAPEVWGALRGLETFSQMIYRDPVSNIYQVNVTYVNDFPRFSFRGFMIDTARHFLSVPSILAFVETLAQSKYNVLHWHVVDDQSFPFQSVRYPNLSIFGAWSPITHVYTYTDIMAVIHFARLRGIRVVPEWDTPGHSFSWGLYYRYLLTPCYNQQGMPDGSYGPLDPTKNTTYDFVANLFAETTALFPDNYLHLGGDEVDFSCWKSNPNVAQFMQSMGFGTDYARLESYYVGRVLDTTIETLKRRPIVWQEVFFNGVHLDKSVIVDIWTGNQVQELEQVTKQGFNAILSACWYLNYISYGTDWAKYYACDPQNFSGSATQKSLVLGGEACMWGEYIDSTNILSTSFPRGSVVAERLWSAADLLDNDKLFPRLEEHRCRMIKRGLRVAPNNGPGYCDIEWHESPFLKEIEKLSDAERLVRWEQIYGYEEAAGWADAQISSAVRSRLARIEALARKAVPLRTDMRMHPYPKKPLPTAPTPLE